MATTRERQRSAPEGLSGTETTSIAELHADQDREAQQQIEESVQRYLSALDTADRTMPEHEFGPRSAHLKDKLSALRKRMTSNASSPHSGCAPSGGVTARHG